MGGRYWQSRSLGNGRREGVSVPLSWAVAYYLLVFWWLAPIVIICRLSWRISVYAVRQLRKVR